MALKIWRCALGNAALSSTSISLTNICKLDYMLTQCRKVVMIAPITMRRQGFGRATILTFLQYIQTHLDEILAEYKLKQVVEKMSLLQLKVKIGSKNEKR